MRRLFVLVAAVILVDTMFYAAIVPLLPGYSDDLGLSKSAAGVLSASYAAGTLLAALPSGLLAARIGVRQTMLVGLGLLSGLEPRLRLRQRHRACSTWPASPQGVGGACAWTGGLAWLLAAGPRERRGELVGSVLAVAIVGLLLGPGDRRHRDRGRARARVQRGRRASPPVLAAGCFARRAPRPRRCSRCGQSPGRSSPRRSWSPSGSSRCPRCSPGLVDVLAPLRLDELGASGLAVGAVFLIAAAIEATMSPAIGRFSDRRGRWTPIRAGLAATALVAVTPAASRQRRRPRGRGRRRVSRDEPDLDAGDGPALRRCRGGRARPRLRHRAGQPLLGRRPGARRLGFVAIADASSDAAAYGLVAMLFALTFAAVVAGRGSAASRRNESPASG